MKQDLTKEELMDLFREFVALQDDNFEDQFWGTKRDAAEDVVTRLCTFMELPPLKPLTEVELAQKKASEAHALWRAAIEELKALKEKENAKDED